MKNRIITIVSAAIFSIIVMGNTTVASGMNKTNDFNKNDNEVVIEKKLQNKGLKNCFNYDICKDISAIIKNNGYKEIAKYIKKCDHEKMQDVMINIEKEDYQKIMEIMKESGYGQMVGMIESMHENGKTKMSSLMSEMKGCSLN